MPVATEVHQPPPTLRYSRDDVCGRFLLPLVSLEVMGRNHVLELPQLAVECNIDLGGNREYAREKFYMP